MGVSEGAEGSQLILVVDDDDDIRDLMAIILRGAGYQVITATDFSSALLQVERFRPELALLDLNMPGLSGLELILQIRRNLDDRIRLIPLVIVSAFAERPSVDFDQKDGRTEFLNKPFQAAALLGQVARLLSAYGTFN